MAGIPSGGGSGRALGVQPTAGVAREEGVRKWPSDGRYLLQGPPRPGGRTRRGAGEVLGIFKMGRTSPRLMPVGKQGALGEVKVHTEQEEEDTAPEAP